MAGAKQCDFAAGIFTIDESYALCQFPNAPQAANITHCCGTAPIKITPDNCTQYCQVDSSNAINFLHCAGSFDPRIGCQGADTPTTTSTAIPTASATNAAPKSPPRASRAAPRSSNPLAKIGLLLALLFFVGSGSSQKIKSCKDHQCQDCNIGDSNDPAGPNEWPIDIGYPNCEIYSGAAFAGAEAASGPGYEVWWDIGQPEPTCQIIVMSPVKQDVAAANCGDVVIAAKQAGCYPSLILDTFMVQYCCGSGDCAAAGVAPIKRDGLSKSGAWSMNMTNAPLLGSFSLSEKRSLQNENVSLESRTVKTTDPESYPVAIRGRTVAHLKRSKPKVTCEKPVNVGDSYTKSVGQVPLSDSLTCPADPASGCPRTVSTTIQVAHSLTVTKGSTITLSGGPNVAIELDLDIFKFTGGANFDVAHAMVTATAATNGTVTGTVSADDIQQVPGTTAYIYFDASLNCQKMSLSCNGQVTQLEKCDPLLGPDGVPQGSTGITYTS